MNRSSANFGRNGELLDQIERRRIVDLNGRSDSDNCPLRVARQLDTIGRAIELQVLHLALAHSVPNTQRLVVRDRRHSLITALIAEEDALLYAGRVAGELQRIARVVRQVEDSYRLVVAGCR